MAKGLILITGASGFIGSHVLKVALKAGYNVRLSVRKQTQIEELKKLVPTYTSQMEFVVVPDVTAAGAFDGAMDGADYVFHLASPMPGKGTDFQKDYVQPAVRGTESILKTANATPSIKRVIVISSILSLMPMGGLTMKDVVIKGKFTLLH
jgi:nucleoside-diphosphate-sugar epimerase